MAQDRKSTVWAAKDVEHRKIFATHTVRWQIRWSKAMAETEGIKKLTLIE